jgi:hypothetical protein
MVSSIALQVHRLAEARGVGTPGTVTAGQRDGATQKTDHRVQIHRLGRREPDCVVDHDENRGDQQEDEEPGPALDEHPSVGGQADRREEDQQQRVFQRHVEGHPGAGEAVGGRQDDGDQAAAHDGGRHAEALEPGHAHLISAEPAKSTTIATRSV